MKKRLYITLTFLFVILISGCVEIQPSDVTSVTVNFTPKSAYLAGEAIVLDEYEVEVFFESQDPMTFTLDDADVTLVGGFYEEDQGSVKLDTLTSGDKSLTVSYGDVSVNVEYSVYDAIVTTDGYTLPGDTSNSTGQTTPINSAIGAVDADDWIFVSDGIYTEQYNANIGVWINKPISLRASESVTLSPDSPMFTIGIKTETGSVTIDGFVIDDTWTRVGIMQSHSYNTPVHILNNWIKAPEVADNHGNSIQFSGSGSRIIGNTVFVTENPAEGWASSGIYLANLKAGTVSDVIISHNRIIREVGSDNSNLAIAVDNFFSTSFDATLTADSEMFIENLRIENNTIQGGKTAVMFNFINNNTGLDDLTSTMKDIYVSNNTFNQTEFGVDIDSDDSILSSITNMVIANNTYASNTLVIKVNNSLTDNVDFGAFLSNNNFNGQTVELEEGDTYKSYIVVPEE